MFHNTEKTETRHGNAPQILFGPRTTMPKSLKEAGFVFLLHKLVFIVSRVDWMCADTTKCAHFLISYGAIHEITCYLFIYVTPGATRRNKNEKSKSSSNVQKGVGTPFPRVPTSLHPTGRSDVNQQSSFA